MESGKNLKELEAELSKKAGVEGFYLEKDREYRSEDDLFEDFSEEERSRLFGKPPATVWENMCGFNKYPEKKAALTSGNILRAEFIDSFAKGALVRWQTELLNRIIPEFHAEIVAMKCLHDTGFYNKCDDELWEKIAALRVMLAKDSVEAPCIFTMIRDAFSRGDFDAASKLKLEMVKTMEKLRSCYHDYKQNIID